MQTGNCNPIKYAINKVQGVYVISAQ